MCLLNMIWPAIFVANGLAKLWYCIFFTIVIEWLLINLFLKCNWKQSFLMSAIGNTVSGLAGIHVLPFAMIFWHAAVDKILPHATFDIINWYCTYILMCLGSVAIETLAVKLIFKMSFRKLFLPLLIGNFMTYLLAGILMAKGILKINYQ